MSLPSCHAPQGEGPWGSERWPIPWQTLKWYLCSLFRYLKGERPRLWVAINGHSPMPDLENSISVFFYSEYLVRELRPSEEIVFDMFKNIYCLLSFKCLRTELLPEYLHSWTFYRSGGTCSICLGRKMLLANNIQAGPRPREKLSYQQASSFTLWSFRRQWGREACSTSLRTSKIGSWKPCWPKFCWLWVQ